jgi:hypothetical protein
MESHKLIQIEQCLRQTLSAEELDASARNTGFMRRKRSITPLRLVASLSAKLAIGPVTTLADLQRGFATTTGVDATYKPFYDQLRKPEFPRFMQAVLALLIARLTRTVLTFPADSPLAQFRDIKIQDATEFKVPDWFRKRFPGRFPVKAPAVAALHVTLSLRRDQPVKVELAPQRTAAKEHRVAPGELAQELLLQDRAYADPLYVDEVRQNGGSCLIRATKRINPKVLQGQVGSVAWAPSHGKKLKEVLANAQGQHVDLQVEFAKSSRRPRCVRFRVVALWNPVTRQHVLLMTNLDPERFPAELLGELYRLRWQIELLFKEWKSFANLHAFTTRSEAITEGLMWASLVAAFLKRYCAHATAEVLPGANPSTQRTAKALAIHLPELLKLLATQQPLRRVLQGLFTYLYRYAQRANPKRDARLGRARLGLGPVGRPPEEIDETLRSKWAWAALAA